MTGEDRFYKNSLRIVNSVFLILILFFVFLIVYYGVIHKQNGIEVDPVYTIDKWTVIDGDGNSFETGGYYTAEKDYDKDFTIVSTIPEEAHDNSFLCLSTGKNLEIYINDELRYSFDNDNDVNIPGGGVKRFYFLVPLSGDDAGAELRIERESTTKRGQIVPETFVSTLGGIYSYMMGKYGLSFMLAEVILIFAVVAFIISIVLKVVYKQQIKMVFGVIGIIVISIWVLTNSLLFPFVFGQYHIDGVLNYMACLMIPFGPGLYLNAIQNGRYKKCMSIMLLISALNALIWPFLHFTGLFPFYEALTIITMILGLLSFAAIVILAIDTFRGYAKEYKYTAIGFLGFLISGLFETIYLNVFTPKHEELPMVIGLGFFLALVVIQQVDDIRNTYQEKQRALNLSESKTKFLASMSHEIRTPINSILGMNEMILRDNKDEVIDEYARGIKSSGKMLLMLVNDVLDFSRIEAGKLEINEGQFCLSDVLTDVTSLTKERAGEKGLEFKTEITADVPNTLLSDEFRIRQILINILNNAVKYTDKGKITLLVGGQYTSADEYELELSVRDTGRGIRKEDQEHLFEAFTRADLQENMTIEGTGLGLAIVKSIVDSMQGSIEVESEYGVGSTFRVKLPAKVVESEVLTYDMTEELKRYVTATEEKSFLAPDARVLAVDDNQSNLTIVRLFLKRTKIQLDLCSGGNEAVSHCREKKYDLILMDHMMPRPDGIETLKLIREDAGSLNRDTTVIVLTANAIAGSRQIYLDAGFADYLTKPIESKVLEETVKKYLPEEKIIYGSGYETEKDAVDVSDGTKSDEQLKSDDDAANVSAGSSATDDAADISLEDKLKHFPGMDYEKALLYCDSDIEFLQEIISDIVSDCGPRLERMRESLKNGDYKAYATDSHSVKSSMATIGMTELSERAKKHEFAAKDGSVDFIAEDSEGFFKEYEDTCKKLGDL